MTSLSHPISESRWTAAAAVRTEVGLARIALAVIGLHIVDDNFLQPEPGTSAADHLVSGLVPLALVVAPAAAYSRLRAGFRAVLALLFGFFGLLGGTEAVHYARSGAISGDDFTGLLSIAAGLVLLGVGVVMLWRSRRRDDGLVRRYGRRALLGIAGLLVAFFVLSPIALAYVVTDAGPADVPAANLGAAYEDRQRI